MTNKPEVVAWRWRKPVVNDQGETVGATAWKLGDAPEFLPWWTNEPLIRLSDYEALQAEFKNLRKDAERYRWLRADALSAYEDGLDEPQLVYARECVGDYQDCIDAAIDKAMQETNHENQ